MNVMINNTHQPLWQLVQNEHESYIMQHSSNKVIPSTQRDETYICDIVELDVAGNPISYTECKAWLWWHDYQHPLHVLQKNIHNHRNELSKGIYKQWSALAHSHRPYCVLITLYKGKATELEQSWQGLNTLPAQHLVCMGQGVQVHIYQVSTLDELTPLYKRYAKVKGAPSHADVIKGTLRDRPTFDIHTLFNASMNETIDLVNGADYQSYISRPSDSIKADQQNHIIEYIGHRYPTAEEIEINLLLKVTFEKTRNFKKLEQKIKNLGYNIGANRIRERMPPKQFVLYDFRTHKAALNHRYNLALKNLDKMALKKLLSKPSALDYSVIINHLASVSFTTSKTSAAKIFKYHYQAQMFIDIKRGVINRLLNTEPKPELNSGLADDSTQQLDLFNVTPRRMAALEKKVEILEATLHAALIAFKKHKGHSR